MSFTATSQHSDPQICRQCRGLCCQGHPGVWVLPQRFLQAFKLPAPSSPEALRQSLPPEVVLRDIDGVAIPAPQSQASGCVFLQEDGCRLTEARRPCQCLALEPSLDTLLEGEIRCQLQSHGSTLTALDNWRRFWAQA